MTSKRGKKPITPSNKSYDLVAPGEKISENPKSIVVQEGNQTIEMMVLPKVSLVEANKVLQETIEAQARQVDLLNTTVATLRSEKQSLSTKLANADAALLLKQGTIADQLVKLAERSKEIESLNDKLSRVPNWIKSLFNV